MENLFFCRFLAAWLSHLQLPITRGTPDPRQCRPFSSVVFISQELSQCPPPLQQPPCSDIFIDDLLLSTQINLVPQQHLGFPSEEFATLCGKRITCKLGEWKQLNSAFVETLPHLFHTSPFIYKVKPSFDFIFSLPGLARLARGACINN